MNTQKNIALITVGTLQVLVNQLMKIYQISGIY